MLIFVLCVLHFQYYVPCSLCVLRLCFHWFLVNNLKVRKTQEGGLNCVLKNFFVPYVDELFSGSESEVIQSLSEFRVVCSG